MKLHIEDRIMLKKHLWMLPLNIDERNYLRRERYRARRAVEKTAMLEARLRDLQHVRV